jgi:hypothetical protein
VSRWLTQFREINPDIHGRANSANSANSSAEGAFGTNGTIGTGVESGKQVHQRSHTPIPGPGADARLWSGWHSERRTIVADAVAYDEVVSRWHLLNGTRPDPSHCAGCGELLSGTETLPLPDGGRVHIDDEWACLRRYGKRWRNEAMKALAEIGITP